MMLLQTGAVPSTALELVRVSSVETKAVLAVIALFSLAGWFVIGVKWWQYRRLNRQAERFFAEMERSTRLDEAYQHVMRQPTSPYTRLFNEAIQFFNELRPGALKAEPAARRDSLSLTQLEALKMVLGKEVATERDVLGHHIPWLATIGSVGVLLGLLGTVLGVMDAFVGIAAKGSGNIGSVAPGVAEALVTTVAGLATSIPAIIAYNYFVNKVRLFTGELEGFASELIGTMAREGLI
ncbi:MAG TPA: MotA/TolQ/ExbB proton channel family protein [Gemmatimonadales bacterium]|jgi:biopolymer transport protein TolQ|nr:MotA/TolQ/ExbB proton channel family protein [Gemmatimonadales bacterium]